MVKKGRYKYMKIDSNIKYADSIKRKISLKKKMHQDFLKSGGCKDREEIRRRTCYPMEKFNCSTVLIRSIYDTNYPDNTHLKKDFTGYFKAEPYNFYHNGLQVITGIKTITVKTNENMEKSINALEISFLPYSNIIEYDYDGDEYYGYPHIYCDFTNIHEPFEKVGYAYESKYGYQIIEDEFILAVEGVSKENNAKNKNTENS